MSNIKHTTGAQAIGQLLDRFQRSFVSTGSDSRNLALCHSAGAQVWGMGEELIDSAFLDRRAARACFLVCRTYIISSTQARQHSQHTKTRIYLGPLSLCLSLHGLGLAGLGWSWLDHHSERYDEHMVLMGKPPRRPSSQQAGKAGRPI